MEELEKLLALLKQSQEVSAELGRLDVHEREARKQLESAADYPLESPAAQRKIGEARPTLDLISARRRKLTSPHQAVQKDLEKQFQAVGAGWNSRVSKARSQEIEAFINANLPFYNNDERACRRALEGEAFERLPCAYRWRRAEFHFGDMPKTTNYDLENAVRSLMGHIEQQSKALGW